MDRYVLPLDQLDRTDVALAGGKGAHLGELMRIEGTHVPAGFCVTTAAWRRLLADATSLEEPLARLWHLAPADRDAIRTLSGEVRAALEAIAMPDDVAAAIARALAGLEADAAYAVRSSATAEDLPTASFAGQQDTYLNVVGLDAVLLHVRRCWASLFTERAVTYRLRHGIDHRDARMAVVVQRLVPADAAGVLFTADPVTGNRRLAVVEACFGLGEALVSGKASADVYRVRDDAVIERTVARKRIALRSTPGGGTREHALEPELQMQPVLSDARAVRLAQLGRRIAAHFGSPQDIEWCLVGDRVHIVQSRPITTLFPVPPAADARNRVYLSVGHQQMMTDAMKPLGLSVWQLTTPRPMTEAGGRLFVDVTDQLASSAQREALIELAGRSDPLIADALRTIVERGDFLATQAQTSAPETESEPKHASRDAGPGTGARASHDASPAARPGASAQPVSPPPLATDARIVADLIARAQASLDALKRAIRAHSGPALFDVIRADFPELRRILFEPRSYQAIMAGMEATWWLNERLEAWLGEKNAADTLAQSAPGNVTSEMGLALLDVADAIRPHPQAVAFLERVADAIRPHPQAVAFMERVADVIRPHPQVVAFLERVADAIRPQPGGDARVVHAVVNFLDELPALEGGCAARDAIVSWLDRYGMRCIGEIDITRPRWRERPAALVPMILGNVRNFAPGEAGRRLEQGRDAARRKQQELLARLRALPDGARRAEETARMIERLRTFIGYREYPKYAMVSRYFVYRQALLEEAARLVDAGVLRQADDIDFLRFEELHDVVRTGRVDEALIRARRAAFASYRSLTPPRVLTSDGEAVTGAYRREGVPPGALPGLPVSAGIVEGRARVVRDVADADLEPGDILVTAFTDPSWTPLFVAVHGLVTEVGGLMTHGAVIAREYGLPAVVGVEHATRRVRDGQRIRVDGTHGHVEILG